MSIDQLEINTIEFLKKSTTDIEKHINDNSSLMRRRLIAYGIICESESYLTSAWRELKAGALRPSIMMTRWLVEAAMDVMWACHDNESINSKLDALTKRSFQEEKKRLRSIQSLYPDSIAHLEQNIAQINDEVNSINVGPMPNLADRMRLVPQPGNFNMYDLYRICCEASHPRIELWNWYKYENDVILKKKPRSTSNFTIWLISASSFYLAIATLNLAQAGEVESARKHWLTKISPFIPE